MSWGTAILHAQERAFPFASFTSKNTV